MKPLPSSRPDRTPNRRTVLRTLSSLLFAPTFLGSGLLATPQAGKFGVASSSYRAMGGREVPPVLDKAQSWIIKRQEKDGSWSGEDRGKAVQMTAMASLFLLGYKTKAKNEKKQEATLKGIGWLRRVQDRDSGAVLGGEKDVESELAPLLQHAFAAEALAEGAYFRVGAKMRERRDSLRGALQYLAATRLSDGSWPSTAGSEIGCVATTLAAGQAHITAVSYGDGKDKNRAVGREVVAWLQSAAAKETQTCEDSPLVAGPDEVRLAGSILLRHLLGDRPGEVERAELCERLSLMHPTANDGEVDLPWRVYYGSFAAFQLGQRDCWSPWNQAMKSALLPHQRKSGKQAGAWIRTWEDDREGGRLFGTLLSGLTLTVYDRYGRSK